MCHTSIRAFLNTRHVIRVTLLNGQIIEREVLGEVVVESQSVRLTTWLMLCVTTGQVVAGCGLASLHELVWILTRIDNSQRIAVNRRCHIDWVIDSLWLYVLTWCRVWTQYIATTSDRETFTTGHTTVARWDAYYLTSDPILWSIKRLAIVTVHIVAHIGRASI